MFATLNAKNMVNNLGTAVVTLKLFFSNGTLSSCRTAYRYMMAARVVEAVLWVFRKATLATFKRVGEVRGTQLSNRGQPYEACELSFDLRCTYSTFVHFARFARKRETG